jgi:hypothetical protein
MADLELRSLLPRGTKVLGMDHPDTLTSVFCLAHLLSAMHDYHQALDLYNRAITGYNLALGPEHPTTIACQRHRALMLDI